MIKIHKVFFLFNFLKMIDEHIMSIESCSILFNIKDCGFNTKSHSWYKCLLINLNVYNEWYKGVEKTK
jgi:hypothetical protein